MSEHTTVTSVFQTGDLVTVGQSTVIWTITALHGETATLRTGVGRLGRNGRTLSRPVGKLTAAF